VYKKHLVEGSYEVVVAGAGRLLPKFSKTYAAPGGAASSLKGIDFVLSLENRCRSFKYEAPLAI
jgi:hypothetical protein